MFFALFILEQLKEEVDTMISGGLRQRWGAIRRHKHERRHFEADIHSQMHELLYDCALTGSPGSRVQQNSCLLCA